MEREREGREGGGEREGGRREGEGIRSAHHLNYLSRYGNLIELSHYVSLELIKSY